MEPLVIYHAKCTDGFAAAFAARLKLGDDAEYLPMNYNDDRVFVLHDELNFPVFISDRDVYILDFSFPREVMVSLFSHAKKVIWLDHHKTAFEMWCRTEREYYRDNPSDIDGNPSFDITLDNNKSGALLAWEYFHPEKDIPLFVKMIDDRDRWKFKLNGSKEFHAGLASFAPWSFTLWAKLFLASDGTFPNYKTIEICLEGEGILRAQDFHVEQMVKNARKCSLASHLGYLDEFKADQWIDELDGLAVNAPIHMSEVGHALANKSGTFGLVYYIGPDNKVKLSFRSNGDYDVSAIAKALGGGGHKNAAGAETDVQTLMGWLKLPYPNLTSK